jgi:hypothetical protein
MILPPLLPVYQYATSNLPRKPLTVVANTGCFKALVQYLRSLLGHHLELKLYIKFLQIRYHFGVTTFNVCVAFIIVIVEFYKMDTIRCDIKCQLIPSLQRKNLHSPLVAFFNHHPFLLTNRLKFLTSHLF